MAAVTVFSTPDDGRKGRPKHVEHTCSCNKHNTARVASCLFIIYYRLVMNGNSNIYIKKEFCLVCFLKYLVQLPNIVPFNIRHLSPVWYPVALLKSADDLDDFVEGDRKRCQSSRLSVGLWGSCVWILLMPYNYQFCLILNIHCTTPGTSLLWKCEEVLSIVHNKHRANCQNLKKFFHKMKSAEIRNIVCMHLLLCR